MSEKKFKRVFLALDTNNIKSAENYIKLLKNDLAGIKIGKELFFKELDRMNSHRGFDLCDHIIELKYGEIHRENNLC